MGAPQWSEQDIASLKAYFPAIGPVGTATKLGRGVYGIMHKARELGLVYTAQRDNRDLYPEVPWQLRIDGRNQREGILG